MIAAAALLRPKIQPKTVQPSLGARLGRPQLGKRLTMITYYGRQLQMNHSCPLWNPLPTRIRPVRSFIYSHARLTHWTAKHVGNQMFTAITRDRSAHTATNSKPFAST
ncbi:hypothetical protein N7509_008217 [Penicillium cosmopolitanum]|uniref:Uncharacterized protein n=1 Tax=Penicillium cosmopolitanum TaxID=1131564 RepID=A0A9W9VM60_9EURO|nr:uncharacterized protein N7509_008217 [Penicillium cosmopolitanum]KAJ5385676.1 hypothetical protein N7509_008217 [Penicillium cosmopolitanum]